MLNQIILISSILFFVLVGFLIKNRKAKSVEEYTIHRNRLGWFPIATGISMTFAGGASLIAISSLGYAYSWYTLVDPVSLIIGILIVLVFIKKYREGYGATISDLLAKSDKKLSLLIGIITSIVFLLIVSAQFVALSKILIPFFPELNPSLLIIVPSALIFSYILFGGFSSVTKTDIIQFVFISLLFVLPVLYFSTTQGISEIQASPLPFERMPLNLMILLSLPLLFIPISQDINIRVKSAINKKQARKGLLFGSFFYFTIIATSTFVGISMAQNGIVLDDPEQVFSVFFKTYFPKIGIISVIAALAAIVSSMDSYALNAISSISKDILFKFSLISKHGEKTIIKISALIVFIISISIALFFNQVLSLILTSLLLYVSVLIPISIGKKLKISDSFIFLSSILLILSIVSIEILKIDIDPRAIIYPISGIGLMIIFYFFEKVKYNYSA